MPALYFLGNKLLASGPALSKWDDSRVNHQNIAHFCPQCGEIWGRIMDERVAGWACQITLCRKHGSGSFIAPWRWAFDELPPEVLRYELQIRLDSFQPPSN